MTPLARVHHFSISLDGFGTGEGQSHDAQFRSRRGSAAPMDVRHPQTPRPRQRCGPEQTLPVASTVFRRPEPMEVCSCGS